MALVRSRVNERRQQIQFTDAAYSESYGSSSSQFVSASNAQTVKKSPRFASLASLGSGDSSGEDNDGFTISSSPSGSPAHPRRNRFISPSIASSALSAQSTSPSGSSATDAANSATTASDPTASSGTRLSSSAVGMRQDEFAGLVANLEAELQARDIVIALLKTEREREREQNTKYAIGCRSDPFAALRRDAVYEAEASADAAGGASSDGSNPYVESTDGAPDEELAQANAELEAQPLHHLDCLIQRHARERQQLARRVDELDAKYSKAVNELETLQQRHEREQAQGDDMFMHLEKERERLNKTLEHERIYARRLERDLAYSIALVEEYRERCERQRRVGMQLVRQQRQLRARAKLLALKAQQPASPPVASPAVAEAAKSAGNGTSSNASPAAATSTSAAAATRNALQAQPPPPAVATPTPPPTAAAFTTPSLPPSVIELELLRNQLLVERAKTRRANEEAERLRLQLDFLQTGDNKHNSSTPEAPASTPAPSTPPPRVVPTTPPVFGAAATVTVCMSSNLAATQPAPQTVSASVAMTERDVSVQKRQSSSTPPKRNSTPVAVSTSAASSTSTAAITLTAKGGGGGVAVSQPPATGKTPVDAPFAVPVSSNPAPIGSVLLPSSGANALSTSPRVIPSASEASELDALMKNLYEAKIPTPILPSITISSNPSLQANAGVRSPGSSNSSPASKSGPGPTFTAGLITAGQLGASPSLQSAAQPALRNNSPLASNLSRQAQAQAATGAGATQQLPQPKPAPPTRISPPQPPAGAPSQYLYQQGAAVVPLQSTFEVKRPVPSAAIGAPSVQVPLIGTQPLTGSNPLIASASSGPRLTLTNNLMPGGSIPTLLGGSTAPTSQLIPASRMRAAIGGASQPPQSQSQSEEVFLSSSGGVRLQHLPTAQLSLAGYRDVPLPVPVPVPVPHAGLAGGHSYLTQSPLPPLLSTHHLGLVNSGSALGSVGVVGVAAHMNGAPGSSSGPIPVPIPIPQPALLRGEAAFPSGSVLQASLAQQSRKAPAASLPTSTSVK